MPRMNLLSGINVREWPKALPQSVRTLDWRVGSIALLAIGALVLIAIRMLRSGHVTPNPLPVGHVTPKPLSESTKQKFMDADLGFTEEELKQIDPTRLTHHSTTGGQMWTFGNICEFTLRALDIENGCQTGPKIIINSGYMIDFLNFGLEEGISYEDAVPAEKQKSWIMQILRKLKDKHYIADATVTTYVVKNYSTGVEVARNEITIRKKVS